MDIQSNNLKENDLSIFIDTFQVKFNNDTFTDYFLRIVYSGSSKSKEL